VINGEQDAMLAARRAAELMREAERSRLAAEARPRRSIRLRLGSITVLIEHQPHRPNVSLPESPRG
jgi:beta-galactosidase beta subunit